MFIDHQNSPLGRNHVRVKKLNKNYLQKLFNLGKEETRLFKQSIDMGIVPLEEKHIRGKVWDKMTGREDKSNASQIIDKEEQCDKINSYIPNYLHKKFPFLKKYDETLSKDSTSQKIRKKFNLTSNTKINTGRGITNGLKIRMYHANSM